MKISTKLKLNSLVVLVIIVLNVTVALFLVQRIVTESRQQAEGAEPLDEAVLEMEINVGETAQAVLDYIIDHEDHHIDKIHDSERDFERFAKVFEELAVSEKEQSLGREVAAVYRDFKMLGEEITSISKRRNDNLLLLHKDVKDINEVLQQAFAVDRADPEAVVKIESILGMEINIGTALTAINSNIFRNSSPILQIIRDAEADFAHNLTSYRKTTLSADEKKWLDRIEKNFADVVKIGNEIVTLTDSLDEKVDRFTSDIEEIDRILDEELQVLVHSQMVQTAVGMQRLGKITVVFILISGILIFAVVIGMGRFVSKRIVDSVNHLSKGAAEFGRGNLGHRIEARTEDELGALAETFNKMADDRKRAEDGILASEQQLRASNQQLSASEQQLRASNQQLSASEQGLRASNQQLFASEQQLRASNQQLGASEQQLKTTNRQLEANQRQLNLKNEELQSIVYISSHDLKSPLVNINGFCGFLTEHCDEMKKLVEKCDADSDTKKEIMALLKEDIPTDLDYISTSTQRMRRLIEGLLQVSRIGTVKVKIQNINVNDLVSEIIDNVKYKTEDLDAEIVCEDLPDCIGDNNQITQVFTNLIDNALKYLSPKRKGCIKITGKTENNDSVYCIEDNGIGIREAYYDKIFEIYHRLDPQDSAEGDGLGLTIVRRVLDRHKGATWVESEPDKETKFFVKIPAKEGNKPDY